MMQDKYHYSYSPCCKFIFKYKPMKINQLINICNIHEKLS